MQEIRCGSCHKKLGVGDFRHLCIKCPRCGTINDLRAESSLPECRRASAPGVVKDGLNSDHPVAGRQTPPRR
ncbi:MAG: Com family DNA-binding transcriptional regulator [Collimonas sp.]|uniref:Com family DNA-binding transcriptional regulator n=1 Tax=Collimonas sp. TaxID=1963772 RepID=UPI0032651CF7